MSSASFTSSSSSSSCSPCTDSSRRITCSGSRRSWPSPSSGSPVPGGASTPSCARCCSSRWAWHWSSTWRSRQRRRDSFRASTSTTPWGSPTTTAARSPGCASIRTRPCRACTSAGACSWRRSSSGDSHRWLRVAAVAHPVLMTLAVTATGNHYLVDSLAGALVALLAVVAVGAGRQALAPRHSPVGRAAVGRDGQGSAELDAPPAAPRDAHPRRGNRGLAACAHPFRGLNSRRAGTRARLAGTRALAAHRRRALVPALFHDRDWLLDSAKWSTRISTRRS